MEQFIGNKKVRVVSLVDEKTPNNNEMVKVTYEDNSEEVMPKARFEMIKTTEISDASTVQLKLQRTIGSMMYSMMHEYGILMGEADGLINTVADLVNLGYEKARDIKWGFEHRFLPLNEINKVNMEYNAKNNINGTASTGSGTN